MMKSKYFSIFSIYFVFFFVCMLVFRLIFFHTHIGEREEYEKRYRETESFVDLNLDAGKHIPFLRLHRTRDESNSSEASELGDEYPSKIGVAPGIDLEKDTPEIVEESDETQIELYVFPTELYQELSGGPLLEAIQAYTNLPFIRDSISDLGIYLFPQDTHTRGRMSRKKIYLYSLGRIPQEEAFSVFVHEFGHYYDIHSLLPTRFGDVSTRFYELSWQEVDVLKPGLSVNDFVSGYAMTNMYEDFAETYTYYVLHNSSFREKKSQSPILRQKYDFFEKYSFPKKEFFNRRFSVDESILPYYWDITKIEIDIEKFLQYVNLYL